MSNQPPKEGTKAWQKNEKIINNVPALKQARDIREGIAKPDRHYKQTHGGKGSAPRPGAYSQQYKDNWERIFGGDRSNVNHREDDES